MELKYIVYITINQCNGKFYIGVHKTNPDVFDGYIGCGIYRLKQANKDYPFHRAVKKYGYENFKRTTIQIFPDTAEGKQQAYELEKTLVNTTLLSSRLVYNSYLGGSGGSNDKYAKRIYQFDLNGEYLTSYFSSREAAQSLNEDIETARQAIRNNCSGRTQSAYGYFWSYQKMFTYKQPEVWRKIAQYTLSGKFIRTFDSIIEAETELGLTSIKQALMKGFQSGGYQWRYFTDTSNINPLISRLTKNVILPIIMINIKTKQEIKYDSIEECINANPLLQASQINRVLKKVIYTHKGYTFKYQDEDIV